MKNGAWLLLSTPNARCLKARLEGARWINCQNPTHFYYFTRRSLRRTIEKAGFGSITTENFHFRYPGHSALRRASQRAIVPLGLGGELLFTARVESALEESNSGENPQFDFSDGLRSCHAAIEE